MPLITASELKVFRSTSAHDLPTNGGRMSASELVSGTVGNVFPNIEESERAVGSVRYRKMFFKVHHNESDKVLLDARLYQSANSEGDDKVQFFIGTQTNTQGDITGAERLYGCADLNTSSVAGATSLEVAVEPGVTGIFEDGDMIRIADASGLQEFVFLAGVPVQAGDIVTLALSTPLSNPYSSADTLVSSVYQHGDLQPSYAGLAVSSAGGDYTPEGNLTLNNEGALEQTWTLTFTSAAAFDIEGDSVGPVGSGTTGGGAAPSNPAFAVPYFTLGAAGFSGAFSIGDTIVFTTHPAAIPVWLKRTVPVDAAIGGPSTARIAFLGGTT